MLASDVVERAERRVGTTLCGKWKLDGVLGVGGMATVYAATHRNRNRVAIKLLHAELSIDEGVKNRFLREGYAANTIEHPGTVKVLDDDVTEDGQAFLVMELLEGESVEERAVRKGGVLPLAEALDIANQLLDVLHAAHERGIVHRDIKPDNLFIAEGGRLKVLDFGIARMRQGSTGATRVGSFMGTPAYSAPEQARGRWNEVDARSDLFAVGATLFSTLTGRPVHEAETPSEQLALAISTPAPPLRSVAPDIPEGVAELVDRSLSYDKADRYATAREMQEVVKALREQVPLAAPLSIPPRRHSSFNVDRGAETLLVSSFTDGRRKLSRTPSFGGLTTTPATPQALASVRRIAAGVLLAGGTGLAVGLGAWWLAPRTVAEPSRTIQDAPAHAAPSRPDTTNRVVTAPAQTEPAATTTTTAPASSASAPSLAVAAPQGAVAPSSAGSAEKSDAAAKGPAAKDPDRAAHPKSSAEPKTPEPTTGTDDLYDIRY